MKLHTYVLMRFLSLFLLVLFCSLVIFLVIDVVENTRFWVTRPRSQAVLYYLYYIPHIIYLIYPIAVLLAAVFSVGILARNFEIVAMKASGVSLWKISVPLLLFGVFSFGILYYLSDRILPDANYQRFRIKEPESENDYTASSTEKHKFVFIGPHGTTYFFQNYSGVSKMGREVTLLKEKSGELIERHDGRSLVWEDSGWVLYKGIQRGFEENGVQAVSYEKKFLPELKDSPEDLVNLRLFPDEMNYKTLQERISIMRRSGESTRKLETQLNFKLSGCLVGLVLVLFGIAFSANTLKAGLTKKFAFSLLLAFSYYILLRFGIIFGENGTLSPVLGAWFGNIVFGAVGSVAFLKASLR